MYDSQNLLTNLNLSSLLRWNWFDNYFCTIKSVKYVHKKSNGPINWKTLVSWELHFPQQNLLQQKQNRQINCQNCIIDSNICAQQSETFSSLFETHEVNSATLLFTT